MDAKHWGLHLVGVCFAVFAVRWATLEMPRDWRNQRVPLIAGPFDWRLLLPVLAAFAGLVPVLYAIISGGFIPRDAPGSYVFMLCWLTAGFISALLAMNARSIRRSARGWLIISGSNTLHIAVENDETRFQLGRGSVELRHIDGPSGYVQFRIQDGPAVAHFWGQIALRHLKLVGEGPLVPGQGLMIGSSIKPLLEWLKPFIDQR